jgi:hypothetical protein
VADCGFTGEQLPFPDLSTPTIQYAPEFMGLAYNLPDSFKEPEDPEDHDVLADFLDGINWTEDKDLPVDADQFASVENDSANKDEGDNAKEALLAFDIGPEVDQIEQQLTLDLISMNCIKPLGKRETMLEFYERLVKSPWVPFKKPDDSNRTDLDEEEHQHFMTLMQKHKYKDSTSNYKKFEVHWDAEVANSYKKKVLQGNNSVLLI